MSERRPDATERLGRVLERTIAFGTCLMAPISIGLIVMLALIVLKFLGELIHALPAVFGTTESDLILTSLSVVDFALVGNLLMVVALAGYSGFIARIMGIPVSDNVARLGSSDRASIKLKLIASIIGISGIRLLERFIYPAHLPDRRIFWQVTTQIVIVLSGLFLALTDRVSGTDNGAGNRH